ncbi:MAG: hypothetical protein AAB834_05555 [Patescibacteria group bacterium]
MVLPARENPAGILTSWTRTATARPPKADPPLAEKLKWLGGQQDPGVEHTLDSLAEPHRSHD